MPRPQAMPAEGGWELQSRSGWRPLHQNNKNRLKYRTPIKTNPASTISFSGPDKWPDTKEFCEFHPGGNSRARTPFLVPTAPHASAWSGRGRPGSLCKASVVIPTPVECDGTEDSLAPNRAKLYR